MNKRNYYISLIFLSHFFSRAIDPLFFSGLNKIFSPFFYLKSYQPGWSLNVFRHDYISIDTTISILNLGTCTVFLAKGFPFWKHFHDLSSLGGRKWKLIQLVAITEYCYDIIKISIITACLKILSLYSLRICRSVSKHRFLEGWWMVH